MPPTAACQDPGPSRLSVGIVTSSESTVVSLVGEADLETRDVLDRHLTSAGLRPRSDVVLDVGELTFADVASVCRCAAFAVAVHRSGRSLTTRGASHLVQRVATLCGVEDRLAFA